MYRSLYLCLLLAFPLSSFAQNYQSRGTRGQLENSIVSSIRDIQVMLSSALSRMSDAELRIVNQLLAQIKNIASSGSSTYQPEYPVYRPVTCSNDNVQVYQQTFTIAKNFAFSSDGQNLSSSASTSWATNWTNNYPCGLINKYMQDFKRIKVWAFSNEGLNLSSISSNDYANKMVSRVCLNYNFESQFKSFYEFAFSSSGLNMSIIAARDYARQRVEPEAFNCMNF